MKKKLLIGLGAITVVATPIVAVVSCGSSSKKVNVSDFKVGGGSTTNNPTGSQTGSNGVVNHQPTSGVSNPVVNTPSHSANTITNTWTAPTFTATPRAAGSHENDAITAIDVDVLKTGFSFGGTNNAGSLYNNGTVKSSGFRYDFVYKTSSVTNKAKNQLSNGDVVTVTATTTNGDSVDLGDVTVSGLHAPVKKISSWTEYATNFPQKIEYDSKGIAIGLFEGAFDSATINGLTNDHVTIASSFVFPDSIMQTSGFPFRDTIWEDGATLVNTHITSINTEAFAKAYLGKKFELPDTITSYGNNAFSSATFTDAFLLKGRGAAIVTSTGILNEVKAVSGFEISKDIDGSAIVAHGLSIATSFSGTSVFHITDGGHWVDASGNPVTGRDAQPGWYITK